MKTPLRNSLIIILLGLFSSCAEQFREIRGSENRGNAFLGTGIATSTATKRTDKTKGERVMPQQTVIPGEQAASEIAAENDPKPNPIETKIEKVESNPTSVSQGQKSRVSGKVKKDQIHSLKKTKLLKPAKILKKALLQRGNGKEVNGWLMALGILGLISSLIGLLFIALLAYVGSGSIIMELLGYSSYPLRIDFILFLLGFISSIWVVANPTLRDDHPPQIFAILLTALSIFLILFLLIGIINE